MKIHRYILAYGPMILWMTLIFLFSSRTRISVSEEEGVNFLFFKTLHVIEYAVLFVLSYRAIVYGTSIKRDQAGMAAFIITFLYAISDELHQTFVPTREGHVRDVIIDGIGASLAWIGIERFLPRLPKKLVNWVRKWQIL